MRKRLLTIIAVFITSLSSLPGCVTMQDNLETSSNKRTEKPEIAYEAPSETAIIPTDEPVNKKAPLQERSNKVEGTEEGNTVIDRSKEEADLLKKADIILVQDYYDEDVGVDEVVAYTHAGDGYPIRKGELKELFCQKAFVAKTNTGKSLALRDLQITPLRKKVRDAIQDGRDAEFIAQLISDSGAYSAKVGKKENTVSITSLLYDAGNPKNHPPTPIVIQDV